MKIQTGGSPSSILSPGDRRRRKLWYLAAIGIVAAAALVRLGFLQTLGTRATYVTFYPAVMLAALYGGLPAGLLATILSGLLADYFWLEPRGFGIEHPADWLSLAIFLASGAMISGITEAMHRARARAHAAETQASLAGVRQREHEVSARLAAIVESSADAIISKNLDGAIQSWNAGAQQMFGYRSEEIIGQSINRLVPPECLAEEGEILQRLARGEPIKHYETVRLTKAGDRLAVSLTASPLRDGERRLVGASKIVRDITERKVAEREREITVQFLGLINSTTGLPALIKGAADFFREQSGCEAIGVRLKEGDDYPYCETLGFPKEFVLAENSLLCVDANSQLQCGGADNPILACMCGNVICERFDQGQPFFTAAGSFWTNSTTQLLASTTETDRQARTRTRCNSEGYESVALIALRAGGVRLGLLQLNDKRPGRFKPELIAFWERLGGNLAVAIAKARAEAALKQARDELETRVQERTAELKQASETVIIERQRFKDVLDQLPAYLVLLSPDYHVRLANRFFEERFGKSNGRRCYEYLFNRIEPCEVCESFTVLKTKAPHQWDWTGPDGRNYDIHDFPFIDVDGSPLIMEVGLDITERKQAETELARYRDHLEELVKLRTAELARSNEELEQFAYVASHDLQEPLRAVAGYLGLIEGRLGDKLDDKDRRHLTGAVQGAARMHTLITDLLSLSRVNSQGKAFAPTDLNTVLDDTLDGFRARVRDTGARITHDPLPTLLVDPGQITQLFHNLIGNALKFHGDRPSEIHVRAHREPGQWVVAVQDNGLGIEPEYFERIFVIFQRLHTRKQYPGTGIGLAICKKIVERHGGRIWVESQPGQGSTFFFTIPHQSTP